MCVGINCRHRYQNIDRVVIFVVKHQRRFQRHQRKTGFLDPFLRTAVRHRQAWRNHKVRAKLLNAIKDGLVVAWFNHISLNQQIHAKLYRFLPGTGLGLQKDGTIVCQRVT